MTSTHMISISPQEGKMPTTKERSLVKPISAVTSNSSQDVATREEMCAEQDGMMREWVMSRMPSKLLPYFKNVKNAWDRSEVIISCIRDLNYKDIILVPKPNQFTEEMKYNPYFKLTSLASLLGYSKPADLFISGRTLNSHKRYTLKELKDERECTLQTEDYTNSIIPEHLDNKSDPRNNDYIYIDMTACEDLISAAMKQSKFREKAKEFKDVLTISTEVTNAIISKLNQLVAEYRYQQQLTNAEAANQKLIVIEQKEQDIADKQKKLEDETKLLALKAYPDVDVQKSHYGYIFSSPDNMKRDLYKIGITDNLKKRESDAHTYCPEGKFYYTVDVYDSRSTETTLHQVLKKYQLQYKINSGDEWFKVPGLDEAKVLIDMAANNTNNIYEHVSTYPSQLRDRFIKPDTLMITDGAGANTNDASTDTGPLTLLPPPPIKEFIGDVLNKIKDDKSISKTNMTNLLKTTSNSNKYRIHRTKLPTNMDDFITSSMKLVDDTKGDDDTNDDTIPNIKLNKKTSGKRTTITIIKIVIEDG